MMILACQSLPRALVTAEPARGAWPLTVSLSAEGSTGADPLSYRWDLGDGGSAEGIEVEHDYLSVGSYDVTLTLTDRRGGSTSESVRIEVTLPDCPLPAPAAAIGTVTDTELGELSGIASSLRSPEIRYWVHEDSGNPVVLTALDETGAVRARHPVVLPNGTLLDPEDIAVAAHPDTGSSWLFLADIGDNPLNREQIGVVVLEEPDPDSDGEISGLPLLLRYPDGPHDAETLLVDPRSFDLFIVTKRLDGQTAIFRKGAPHDSTGPHLLEQVASLSFSGGSLIGGAVTGGDISADGSHIVLRTYLPTAYLWRRDGIRTVGEALLGEACPIALAPEPQAEAIAFDTSGASIVTVSEGTSPTLYRIGLE